MIRGSSDPTPKTFNSSKNSRPELSSKTKPNYYQLMTLVALITTTSCSSKQAAIIPATPLDHLNFVFGDSLYGLTLPVGECNGLLLTTTEKPASFAIWNPLTHERLDLPTDFSFPYDALWSFGLGYDGATDDYKAVAILRNRSTHVYSLKSDSWRSIIDCCPPSCEGDWRGRLSPGVFVHGSLFWFSTGKGSGAYDDNKIVALDLGTEKYSMLQMPPQTRREKYHSMLLYVLGGSLVLSDCGDHGYDTHSDVWVMKKKDSSWIRLFSIDWESNNVSQWRRVWRRISRPVAFVMKEKLLVLHTCDRGFFLFDVDTKSLKSVEIDDAKQTFVGTIFRLHANCGVGGGVRRKIIATTTSTSASKKAAADQLVFSIGDTVIVKEGSCVCPLENEEDV